MTTDKKLAFAARFAMNEINMQPNTHYSIYSDIDEYFYTVGSMEYRDKTKVCSFHTMDEVPQTLKDIKLMLKFQNQ